MVKPKKSAATLDAAAWEEAALEAIARGGPQAVAVEPLARALSVTKGSFYWHFDGRDALLRAALARWERESTEAVIQMVEGVPDPKERLTRLIEVANRRGRARALHAAISAAGDDPIVKPYLKRVTERRLGYLKECYARLGLGEKESSHAALLAYSAYVGLTQLERESATRHSAEQHETYVRYLIATLVPQ